MSAALKSTAQRQLAELISSYPGTVIIGGTTYPKVAVMAKRGTVQDAKGGFKQARMLTIYIDYPSIAEATLVDSTRGTNKRLDVTHLGKSYRLTDDGVRHDPHKTRWQLSAAESVA
jgi:hypothetical protein